MNTLSIIIIVFAAVLVAVHAQTRILPINSFSNGGPSSLNVNGLGLDQGVDGAASFLMDSGRMHVVTQPGHSATFWSTLSASPQCLSTPPVNTIETTLSFRIQLPAGMDLSIILQTGTGGGCQGARNNSAVVRLSRYNDLSGQPTWVHIPLVDFDTTLSDYLNGRLTALVFSFPSVPFPADILFDEMQLVSRPRLLALTSTPMYASQLINGPPSGSFNAPSSNSRCGPQFGWAGCNQGECCSSQGWCGTTPLHCLSVQGVLSLQTNTQMQQSGMQWAAPLANGRCGVQFNWAGCYLGQACSAAGFCGSTPQHFATAQSLGVGASMSQGNLMNGPLMWGLERPDGRCGRDFNWAGCANGCCSQAGVCGNTIAHCSNSQVLGQ